MGPRGQPDGEEQAESRDRPADDDGGQSPGHHRPGCAAGEHARRERYDRGPGDRSDTDEDQCRGGRADAVEHVLLRVRLGEAVVHEEQPAIVAPSAFAWGNEPQSSEASEDDDDRLPGETWIERAYRGPSPNNPSVSLKARLKRAAFFDKRERDVAAGKAQPVDMEAGLPDAMIEEQERELA